MSKTSTTFYEQAVTKAAPYDILWAGSD